MVTRAELAATSTPEALAEYVEGNASVLRQTRHAHGHGPGHGPGTGPMESIREAMHRGHQITIWTTYRIEVDGVPLEGHLAVTNDGRVHYHAMPNVSYDSTVNLVKQLIDAFPDDFGSAPQQGAQAIQPQARSRTPGKASRRGRQRGR